MLNIHTTTEEQLIRDCVKNKSQAQKALYEKYSPKMYGICYRYLKDQDQAQDVLITAFTKIFEKIEQFQFNGSFEGWVRRIMVNESLTFIRKNKYMYLEVDFEHADHAPDYSKLSDQLEVSDLMTMVQNLPIGYRTVFNLYAIEGYSHKEIAKQLGITESTSKSQLSRARAILQKCLIDTEEELNAKVFKS